MENPRILIAYASKYGQTAKIASRIGWMLEHLGHRVQVSRVDELTGGVDVTRFAGVIVGAPVHVQTHPSSVRDFVVRHRAALSKMPSAFFSVSLSAAGRELSQQADARRMLDEFLSLTNWKPSRWASFAGAINYTRYGPLIRWTMRRAAKRIGESTDTSKDHEFTDWKAVEGFAHDFGALVDAAYGVAAPERSADKHPLVLIYPDIV